jgi:hypothetical protein
MHPIAARVDAVFTFIGIDVNRTLSMNARNKTLVAAALAVGTIIAAQSPPEMSPSPTPASYSIPAGGGLGSGGDDGSGGSNNGSGASADPLQFIKTLFGVGGRPSTTGGAAPTPPIPNLSSGSTHPSGNNLLSSILNFLRQILGGLAGTPGGSSGGSSSGSGSSGGSGGSSGSSGTSGSSGSSGSSGCQRQLNPGSGTHSVTRWSRSADSGPRSRNMAGRAAILI